MNWDNLRWVPLGLIGLVFLAGFVISVVHAILGKDGNGPPVGGM